MAQGLTVKRQSLMEFCVKLGDHYFFKLFVSSANRGGVCECHWTVGEWLQVNLITFLSLYLKELTVLFRFTLYNVCYKRVLLCWISFVRLFFISIIFYCWIEFLIILRPSLFFSDFCSLESLAFSCFHLELGGSFSMQSQYFSACGSS